MSEPTKTDITDNGLKLPEDASATTESNATENETAEPQADVQTSDGVVANTSESKGEDAESSNNDADLPPTDDKPSTSIAPVNPPASIPEPKGDEASKDTGKDEVTETTDAAPKEEPSKPGIPRPTSERRLHSTPIPAYMRRPDLKSLQKRVNSEPSRGSRVMTPEEEAQQDKLRRHRQSSRRRGAFIARPVKIIGLNPDADISESPKSSGGLCTAKAVSFVHSPKTEGFAPKAKIVKQSLRFSVSFADTVGRRKTMEDEMIICGQFRGKRNEDLFGVFDGHNGDNMALYVGKHLPAVLSESLNKHQNVSEALKSAFDTLNKKAQKEKVAAGSTACVALVLDNKAYIANTGDCRAVLYQNGDCKVITKDHKPEDVEEEKRICAAGGDVTCTVGRDGKVVGRLNGVLGVSRAFGDFELQPAITVEPDIFEIDMFPITSEEDFLIIACDGVWDVIKSEEATKIVLPFLSDDKLDKAASRLRDVAYARSSLDNISVMILKPQKPQPPPPPVKRTGAMFSFCDIF